MADGVNPRSVGTIIVLELWQSRIPWQRRPGELTYSFRSGQEGRELGESASSQNSLHCQILPCPLHHELASSNYTPDPQVPSASPNMMGQQPSVQHTSWWAYVRPKVSSRAAPFSDGTSPLGWRHTRESCSFKVSVGCPPWVNSDFEKDFV